MSICTSKEMRPTPASYFQTKYWLASFVVSSVSNCRMVSAQSRICLGNDWYSQIKVPSKSNRIWIPSRIVQTVVCIFTTINSSNLILMINIFSRYKFRNLLTLRWLQLDRDDPEQNDLRSMNLPPKVWWYITPQYGNFNSSHIHQLCLSIIMFIFPWQSGLLMLRSIFNRHSLSLPSNTSLKKQTKIIYISRFYASWIFNFGSLFPESPCQNIRHAQCWEWASVADCAGSSGWQPQLHRELQFPSISLHQQSR